MGVPAWLALPDMGKRGLVTLGEQFGQWARRSVAGDEGTSGATSCGAPLPARWPPMKRSPRIVRSPRSARPGQKLAGCSRWEGINLLARLGIPS